MAVRVSFIVCFVFASQSISTLAINATADTSAQDHRLPCEEGWLQQGCSCYRYNDTHATYDDAARICDLTKGHLVFILNPAENRLVTDFVGQRSLKSKMWVGASKVQTDEGEKLLWADKWDSLAQTHQLNFTNWAEPMIDSTSPLTSACCVKVGADGLWQLEDCDVRLPFMCQRHTPCHSGWFGHDCDKQCHCQGQPCESRDLIPVCPSGCLAGWTGHSCDKPNPLVEASYHCLRYPDGTLRANLKVNPKQRHFRHVQAVDESGATLPCALQVTANSDLFYVTLSVADNLHLLSDNGSQSGVNVTAAGDAVRGTECIASEPGDRNVTWLVEFKQYPQLVTTDDVTVEVTCNADDVDDLELSDVIYNAGGEGTRQAATLEQVSISVYLSDAGEDRPRDQVHMGQTLQLHVRVMGLSDDECASPHSCAVENPAHDVSQSQIALLDENGCPVPGSVITSWRALSRDHFSSNPFPSFSTGDDRNLTVSCQVDLGLQPGRCPQVSSSTGTASVRPAEPNVCHCVHTQVWRCKKTLL